MNVRLVLTCNLIISHVILIKITLIKLFYGDYSIGNSVFGTNLKTAMKKKDGYHTDNGKRKCTKRYKMEDLAKDIGYSVNTIYGWTKKDGQLPSSIELKKMAGVLGVDTAFLLGEQVCQRNADQTICNVTELNETSAKLLSELNGISADMMNELLNHKDFDRLILLAWDYTHSHNKEITITNTLDNSKDLPLVNDAQREMMKYRAVDAFGKILDKIYDAHRQDAIDAKAGSILAGMKNDIEPYIENKDDGKIRHSLLHIISYSQNRIKELHPEHVLCKCAPETILDNWEQLKEFI